MPGTAGPGSSERAHVGGEAGCSRDRLLAGPSRSDDVEALGFEEEPSLGNRHGRLPGARTAAPTTLTDLLTGRLEAAGRGPSKVATAADHPSHLPLSVALPYAGHAARVWHYLPRGDLRNLGYEPLIRTFGLERFHCLDSLEATRDYQRPRAQPRTTASFRRSTGPSQERRGHRHEHHEHERNVQNSLEVARTCPSQPNVRSSATGVRETTAVAAPCQDSPQAPATPEGTRTARLRAQANSG